MIPEGWKIVRKDKGPFRAIQLSFPKLPGVNYSTIVYEHDMNPSNILYYLADALLKEQEKNDSL